MSRQPKIAASVAIAVMGSNKQRSKLLETAMKEAVAAALNAGITDPDEIRKRMREAREKAKAAFDAGMA